MLLFLQTMCTGSLTQCRERAPQKSHSCQFSDLGVSGLLKGAVLVKHVKTPFLTIPANHVMNNKNVPTAGLPGNWNFPPQLFNLRRKLILHQTAGLVLFVCTTWSISAWAQTFGGPLQSLFSVRKNTEKWLERSQVWSTKISVLKK